MNEENIVDEDLEDKMKEFEQDRDRREIDQ